MQKKVSKVRVRKKAKKKLAKLELEKGEKS